MGNVDEVFQTAYDAMHRTIRTIKLDVGAIVQLLHAEFQEYLIPPMLGLYGPIGHYPLLLPDTHYVARGYTKEHGDVTLLVTYKEALGLTGMDIYALDNQTRWCEYYRPHHKDGSDMVFLTPIQHVGTEKLIIPKDWMMSGKSRRVDVDNPNMPNRMTQLVTSFVAHAVREELVVPFRSPWADVFAKDVNSTLVEDVIRKAFFQRWQNFNGTEFKQDITKIIGMYYTHNHTVSAVQQYIHINTGIDYFASLKLEEWMRQKEHADEAANILGR